MTAPANELQKAIYDILIADAAVGELVGDRIYDRVPKDGGQYPYVTFGPSDEVPDNAACITGDDHTLQLDVWSQKQGGFQECKEITSAIRTAITAATIDLPTHALVNLQFFRTQHVRDPDGKTSHGIVRLEAGIENNG